MRKLKKDESLVNGKYYLAFGENRRGDIEWFIKVIKQTIKKEGLRVLIKEVSIRGEDIKNHGDYQINYDDVLKQRVRFYELTDNEVAEWKAKITESMI